MVITKVRDVRGENINWHALGKRFKKFREFRYLSYLEAAQTINLTESQIIRFENGFCENRKSTNIIWQISLQWNLSINWLLNGLGKPHDPDPLALMPETLHVQKGVGIRRNYDRLEAEEGSYTDHVLEFVIAIDKFKSKHNVAFPTLTQIYEIVTALGYRKSVPPRIAPLGYIVKHQQWAEKLKLMNEKIEASLYDEERGEKRAAAIAADGSISEAEKQRRLKIGKSARGRGKKFICTDSAGRQHFVDNLPQFCRDHELMPAHIYSVAKGDRKQHKGWIAEVIPECAIK